MKCCVNFNLEIEQVGNGLALQSEVPVKLAYRKGRWYGLCEKPPVETDPFEHLEQALLHVGDRVQQEMQAEVIERPMILGRITPDMLPKELLK